MMTTAMSMQQTTAMSMQNTATSMMTTAMSMQQSMHIHLFSTPQTEHNQFQKKNLNAQCSDIELRERCQIPKDKAAVISTCCESCRAFACKTNCVRNARRHGAAQGLAGAYLTIGRHGCT
jgi:hypothetical protein